MNASDSERVAAIAEQLGYLPTESIENANLVIINSCSIRQKAEDRVIGMGKKIKELKNNNPGVITVLTGCMAKREARGIEQMKGEKQEEQYELGLKKVMPWLDHVVPIKDMPRLNNKLGIDANIDVSEYLSINPKVSKSFSQYIPISTGCNKFCTFCIVPFSRGPEIYRPYKEIKDEIIKAIESGAKEITLVGQNVNSWRGYEESTEYIESIDPHRLIKKDIPEGIMDFANLLDEIGDYLDDWMLHTEYKVWLKFTSSHPYDIDEHLIEVIKQHKSIANQFHFAMQSGSNSVLKRMNRHYSVEDFIKKCELIRNSIPGVGISTDVIVGFCGETEGEFNDTVTAMKDLKFDQAFISEYSTRKGTVAARVYKDNIENTIKAQRKIILNEILSEGNKERNEKMLDKEYDVLIYKKNKLGLVGRTENGKDVVVKDSLDKKELIGNFISVKIVDFSYWSLEGEII